MTITCKQTDWCRPWVIMKLILSGADVAHYFESHTSKESELCVSDCLPLMFLIICCSCCSWLLSWLCPEYVLKHQSHAVYSKQKKNPSVSLGLEIFFSFWDATQQQSWFHLGMMLGMSDISVKSSCCMALLLTKLCSFSFSLKFTCLRRTWRRDPVY